MFTLAGLVDGGTMIGATLSFRAKAWDRTTGRNEMGPPRELHIPSLLSSSSSSQDSRTPYITSTRPSSLRAVARLGGDGAVQTTPAAKMTLPKRNHLTDEIVSPRRRVSYAMEYESVGNVLSSRPRGTPSRLVLPRPASQVCPYQVTHVTPGRFRA